MSNKERAMKRAVAKASQNGKSIEAQAAKKRQERQDACAKEYNEMLAALLKRHNCRGMFVVILNGQALPSEQVLNVPVGFVVTANIE